MPSSSWKLNLKRDIPAGVVVFLVALPLCLGIALASNAPLMSGIVAGIVGGIVVGIASGSRLSVSGPAAGLTTIVITSIEGLKSFELFLLAILIAGVFQVLLGFLKTGVIGNFIPSPVIKGMLAAIGIILILKQIPHALGYDADYEGDESYEQADGKNTFTTIWAALQTFKPAAGIVALITVVILILWDLKPLKKYPFFQVVPGALIAVVAGICLNMFVFPGMGSDFALQGHLLANIPFTGSFPSFFGQLSFPDFSGISNPLVWQTAVTIALVASIESILSIEAVDKIDPEKHITSKDRELKAQGLGNIFSALFGGLPVTAVIVRSSANINAGATSRFSAILHGALLLISVVFISNWLNLIPLASLAGILFFVGFKLTSPKIVKSVLKRGYMQLIPFLVTVFAILFTDLLVGIVIGLVVGMIITIRTNMQRAISFTHHQNNYLIKFKKDVYFLNIKAVKDALSNINDNSYVLIDTSKSGFMDPDVIELIEDFSSAAPSRGIGLEIHGQLEYLSKKKQPHIEGNQSHNQHIEGKEHSQNHEAQNTH